VLTMALCWSLASHAWHYVGVLHRMHRRHYVGVLHRMHRMHYVGVLHRMHRMHRNATFFVSLVASQSHVVCVVDPCRTVKGGRVRRWRESVLWFRRAQGMGMDALAMTRVGLVGDDQLRVSLHDLPKP
jgi:hypothetical protein